MLIYISNCLVHRAYPKERHVPRCAFVLKGIMRSVIDNDL